MQQGLFKRGLAEFIGTFIFVLIAAGSECAVKYASFAGSAESLYITMALASGFGLMVAVYATATSRGSN